MARNSYFSHAPSDQNAVEDLTIEVIKIYGHDMVYIPRTLVNKDEIFGEDTISKFENGNPIEMFIESIDGFEGDGDFISKFGLEIRDSVTFVVSKKRFKEELTDLSAITRPREGDLIYFPMTKGLFEIKFVEHENPFYQVGKLYTYKLSCELFQWSQEDLDTGYSDVDDIETTQDTFAIDLTVSSASGTFLIGEQVGTTGGFNARVVTWTDNSTGNDVLRVHGVAGSLSTGELLTGVDSSVTAVYQSQETTTAIIPDGITADAYDSSDDFQVEADDLFDFTETDPFSEGNF
jgi:hypothetical protein